MRIIFLLLLVAVVLVFSGGFAALYSVLHSALPQLDGNLQVPGLKASVTVSRDIHGVPTIEAADLDDLFFAQGYITAQDRLWQMDGTRRLAAGELSEIVGEDTLAHDRQQRILGLRLAAKKSNEMASPEERARFEAYARGVNAFIESHRDQLPVEFRILHYAPKPWTVEDSLLVAAQMVQDLTSTPQSALVREKILAKLGPELTADLYVNSSWHDRPPTAERPTFNEDQGNGDDEDEEDGSDDDRSVAAISRTSFNLSFQGPADSSFRSAGRNLFFDLNSEPTDPPIVIGSNNWVVSGAHTVSGKPLLSNDMHLGHQMPNIWYVAHLRCGDFDVAGMTLPGLPFVIVGHNQRIAWGFTNVGPTVEDAYIENFDATGKYQTPQGWKDPEHHQEIIHVRGKPDVTLDVLTTRHGPIVSDLYPGETRKIALRWTLYEGMHNPFFDVDRAQNWEQFRHALSVFNVPSQNGVYADIEGNIGYQATGKIPIRAAGDGSLPVSGADNAHEWTGYIPFEKLPSIYNPPWGIIATANGRITPDGYPYSISAEWEAPWRSARIYRVLESGKKFSAADMLALQTDVFSEPDRFFAERFVYAVDHAQHASSRAKQAADILRQWDGRMMAESAAPTLETHARQELMRLLLEPQLGAAPADARDHSSLSWKSYRWGMQSVWLENVLLKQPARWLPATYPNYEELLTTAVEAAVSESTAPNKLDTWSWGKENAISIQHPILGEVPLVRHWTGPGVKPQSGSGYTVKAVSRHHGPSERMTVDLSNLDQSTLNLVTGEAGNFGSPYYMDQWKAWHEGTTFAWPFSKPEIEKAKTHKLILQP